MRVMVQLKKKLPTKYHGFVERINNVSNAL